MAALATGSIAPDFSLNTLDGKPFVLRDALKMGPVLLAFFKVSCPVCQFAFPYLERVYKASDKRVTIVGVSQNDVKDTAQFIEQFGVTFPVLMDDTKTFPVSNSYGLTNVPSLFLISEDGKVEVSSVGWAKAEVQEIYRKTTDTGAAAAVPLFRPDEKVADFRAG